MILLLLMVGFSIEIGLAAHVLVLTHQEKKMLRRLVNRSSADLNGAVDDLPEPYRNVARELADHVAMDDDFDDALLDAIVEIARQPFKKPLWLRLTVGVICSLAFLAPASYGLIATASQIVTTWNEAQLLDRSVVYLFGQTELENPFLSLRDAFRGSAMLFFGLAVLWVLSWCLRRPEVREARFLRALLEAGARAKPERAAPLSGRLSELIAPDRGLRRPITALVICLLGITLGWLVLYQTADVRAANARARVFEVWPKRKERPLAVASELRLPTSRGGAPISDPPPPSLMIGPEKASIGGRHLVDFPEGKLAEDWKTTLPSDLSKLLEPARGRLVLLAHRELELDVVLQLIRHLFEAYRIKRFELIVERTLQPGTPRGKTIQAAIPLEIDTMRAIGLEIVIEEMGIRLGEAPMLSFEDERWKDELQRVVREKRELLRNADRAAVRIAVERSTIGYGRFVELLADADTACIGAIDCGLPGLGLEFTISSAFALLQLRDDQRPAAP